MQRRCCVEENLLLPRLACPDARSGGQTFVMTIRQPSWLAAIQIDSEARPSVAFGETTLTSRDALIARYDSSALKGSSRQATSDVFRSRPIDRGDAGVAVIAGQ